MPAPTRGVLIFYKYLDYKFPGSKFILTVRDLDSWLISMEYICEKYPVRSLGDDIPIMRRMLIYEAVVFDREKFITAFERHHHDIKRYFCGRAEDLLEMNIIAGEGWDKLCPFLGAPLPMVPFPNLNRRSTE